MDRYECRKAIVKDLEEQGYLVKTEPYSHNVGTCYRCHNDVEPLISAQWFVKMEPLAKEAIRVVRGRHDQVCARALHQDLYQLDGERPRLVHLPPALVGPPDPRVVLRRVRPHQRQPRGPDQVRKVRQHAPHQRRGRAGHLVLLRAVAVLHARLAGSGRDDLKYWYPTSVHGHRATTSSSSGSRA